MYPVLFRVGNFDVTSFGVLVALGALVGIRLFTRELARSGLPVEAVNAATGGAAGGLVGAKVVWAVEFSRAGEPFADLLFSRGGLSWFGGFLGGVGTGLWLLRRSRVPLVSGLAAATPALAFGHAIGRVGCFLVGDDYGEPTALPWGVAFPEGLPPTEIPVHPTQLYEAALLTILGWALIRWRRGKRTAASTLALYLIAAGAIRFSIELVRINAAVLGPFTLAQVFSAALMLVGACLAIRGEAQQASSFDPVPK